MPISHAVLSTPCSAPALRSGIDARAGSDVYEPHARSDAQRKGTAERGLSAATRRGGGEGAGGARGCREVSEEETIERSFVGTSASVRVKWGDRLAAEMSWTSPELAMIRQTMSS